MSDKMRPIGISSLLKWIFAEYKNSKSVFGISKKHFFKKGLSNKYQLFGKTIDSPIGPAAGPHTQLTQNIISAYLTGGRFFELKTVQILDELHIEKPCIDAQDECYNVEWSQELKLEESYEEYLKAWLLIPLLNYAFSITDDYHNGYIFNMSVGYNLEGIKSERIDFFIESLKNANINSAFKKTKTEIINFLSDSSNIELLQYCGITDIQKATSIIENISPHISESVTLSTMHGCPANEIEMIASYLIKEKNLHTFIKLNPTLLGFDKVSEILGGLEYDVLLDRDSFEHDLKISDAQELIKRLQNLSKKYNKDFGIKLSNTLGVKNKRGKLPGNEMYMSGRALFPLTINLAYLLAVKFNKGLNFSYSGGADYFNSCDILKTGIFPVTYATDLLKPGGYSRLFETAEKIESEKIFIPGKIDLPLLKLIAQDSLINKHYRKTTREIESIKVKSKLKLFDCYISPCSERCPIHQDVSEYISLVEEGKYYEALEVIYSKNALPHITGYICDHQCVNHCTRWDYENPLNIREIKKEAAEKGYDEFERRLQEKQIENNNIKAAIIGGGPSGLAAAYFLARGGFDVTIFEKKQKTGGIVSNIIPPFRIPEEAINKDIEIIRKFGVKFITGCNENFSLNELKEKGYKYIYISIGAEKSNKPDIQGNGKIIDALDFLWNYKNKINTTIGKNIAVIGGGNSAMDGARAAKKIDGTENVYIIYRRTKEFMPADKEEFDAAIKDGVIFKELLLPVEFDGKILKCQVMELGERDKDGRRKVNPKLNEFVKIEIDTVISAIGEYPDTSILERNGIKLSDRGKVLINPDTNETNIENVYIGGDALRGPSTVVESISDGKRAAENIILKEGMSVNKTVELNKSLDTYRTNLKIINKKGKSYEQKENIREEAERCLNCNIICNKCIDVCPNRANPAIEAEGFANKYQILHIDSLCNECGNCETFCPHEGSPYRDKLTLFTNQEDFYDSENSGFFVSKNDISEILIRENGVVKKLLTNEIAQQKNSSELLKLIQAIIINYKHLLEL